jgi:hypothetical protein
MSANAEFYRSFKIVDSVVQWRLYWSYQFTNSL